MTQSQTTTDLDAAQSEPAALAGDVQIGTVPSEPADEESEALAKEPVQGFAVQNGPDTQNVASGEALSELRTLLDHIAETLEELARMNHRQAGYVDRLHDENRELKAELSGRTQEPLLREVLDAHDTILDFCGSVEAGAAEYDRLEHVGHMLLAAVEHGGLSTSDVAVGDPFDGALHHGVRTIKTDDPSQIRTISKVVRIGFARDGRVVRKADVEVYAAAPSRRLA